MFAEFMDMQVPPGSTVASEMALPDSVGNSMGEVAAAVYELAGPSCSPSTLSETSTGDTTC